MTFGIVYVFFVLSLERRRVVHINVTTQPHAAWAAQQMVEAIGAEIQPVRLVRDRDGIFGAVFNARVEHLGIEQFRISPRSPWQNGYAPDGEVVDLGRADVRLKDERKRFGRLGDSHQRAIHCLYKAPSSIRRREMTRRSMGPSIRCRKSTGTPMGHVHESKQ